MSTDNWWLRAPAVLVAPRAVFASLRDDDKSEIEARQEPIMTTIALAGVSVVLATREFRQMLNDGSVSGLLIPVLAFISGVLFAAATYWLGGLLLYGAARRLGSLGDYRRARQTLALASAPLALALVTFWPLRAAIYGSDLFRTGGDDYGRGDAIFGGVFVGFAAWSLLLLFVGVRSVHGWTWGRAAAAVLLAAAFPVLIAVATSL